MTTVRAGGTGSRAAVGAEAVLVTGLVVIGAGLVLLAVLGPLLGGVDYRITETLRNQTIGLDAVSLVVVAPLSLAAAGLTARGRPLGPAMALGIGACTAYMMVQYVLGPAYMVLPGDNERLFPLLLVLFAGGWIVALAAWGRLAAAPGGPSRRRDLLIGRVVLPGLGFLAFVRYLPALADTTSASPEDAGYLAGPAFFWAIALLDLGAFLPATVATCAGLVRGAPWAHRALYAVAGWFGLVGPAVAGMAIAMYVNDDPNASAGNVVLMIALGMAFAALAVAVMQPLARRARV